MTGPLDRLLKRSETDPAVLAVILFGSAVRGEAGPTSDLDVCLVLPPGRDGHAEQEAVQVAYLDLCSPRLDIAIFQRLPLYIRSRVLKEGRVVACRDEDALYEVARRTTRAFEGFKRIHREYLEAVARA
jgi:predicted nucleotidyltransferase